MKHPRTQTDERAPIEEEGVVDGLIADGTFEASADGLAPSESLRAAVATRRKSIAEGDMPDLVPGRHREANVEPELLATYAALRERVPEISPTQATVLAVMLESSENERPPESGAPGGFLPVHGDELVQLETLCERCVVYVWRDDCVPCEQVRANLTAVFEGGGMEGVLPLSVYGPDCPAQLQETYDVIGAPTTLFTLDGSVDARFVGVADESAFESELDTLRSRGPDS